MTMPARMLPQLDASVLSERFDGEPSWLTDARAEALAAYNDAALPTTKLEEWRYTDPSKLKWDRVSIAPADTGADNMDAAALHAADISFSARVVQSGARIVAVEVSDELAQRGV